MFSDVFLSTPMFWVYVKWRTIWWCGSKWSRVHTRSGGVLKNWLQISIRFVVYINYILQTNVWWVKKRLPTRKSGFFSSQKQSRLQVLRWMHLASNNFIALRVLLLLGDQITTMFTSMLSLALFPCLTFLLSLSISLPPSLSLSLPLSLSPSPSLSISLPLSLITEEAF